MCGGQGSRPRFAGRHWPSGSAVSPVTDHPGSDEREVPAWDGGNWMMYVKNEGEIREWILHGHPKRLQGEHEHGAENRQVASDSGGAHTHDGGMSHSQDGHASGQEAEAAEVTSTSSPPLQMPAFEDVLSTDQVNDLVAYYKAVALFEQPPPQAREGRRIAARLGCFSCHGPGGRVGSSNPRSFKGYIPPWQGEDYAELVRSDDELRQWILEGTIDRLENNPLARYFTKRQIIQMPAYRNLLNDEELGAVLAYIRWLQEIELQE
jgi:mono/diheme cytochrome c family protein